MWPFVSRRRYDQLQYAYSAQTQELMDAANAHRVFMDTYINRYRTIVRRVRPNNDKDWRIRVVDRVSGRSVMNMAGPNVSCSKAIDRAESLPFPVIVESDVE